jgi:integrase
MTNNSAATKPEKSTTGRLSKDGKWRSFPKVPGLLQYVSTAVYFARTRHKGKLIRQSLETTVYTTAKEKLPDFRKKHVTKAAIEGTFADALAKYEWSLEHDYGLSPFTKRYRKFCIDKILETWPGIKSEKLNKIEPKDCKIWAEKLSKEIEAQYFNNTLGTLRLILEKGGITKANDPTRQPGEEIKRLGVTVKRDELPEDVLAKLVNHLKGSSAWRHHRAAEVVQFLAYSGCRLSEAQQVTWGDIDLAGGFITVHNAKKRNYQNHETTRLVPVIEPMRELLATLGKDGMNKFERVIPFAECYKSLKKACEDLKIPRLKHHTFRAWFATRAIEKAVDIATVAEWCGHVDGGALLLKRYAKANKAHSLKMAEKMTFGGKGAA